MASDDNASPTPLPRNIEVLTDFDAIVLRRNWRSGGAYAIALFALVWNGFMVAWMSIALADGAWTMAAFGSIHALVGIGMGYFALASFLNHTDIRINPNVIEVRHAPLPWFGKTTIPVHEVAQLYCAERVTRSKNGTRVSYELRCLDRGKRARKLLSGLQDREQARYIEREIESILGIADRPVSGELQK